MRPFAYHGEPVTMKNTASRSKPAAFLPMIRHALNIGLTTILIIPIRLYQICVSPLTPASCRFTPTCSQYAIEAIKKHGPLKGLYLAVRRVLKCHPWGGSGYDPVP